MDIALINNDSSRISKVILIKFELLKNGKQRAIIQEKILQILL